MVILLQLSAIDLTCFQFVTKYIPDILCIDKLELNSDMFPKSGLNSSIRPSCPYHNKNGEYDSVSKDYFSGQLPGHQGSILFPGASVVRKHFHR